MKITTIKQKLVVPASPEEVYEAFMDAEKHSAFTGSQATCDPRILGKFTAWDDISPVKIWNWNKGRK